MTTAAKQMRLQLGDEPDVPTDSRFCAVNPLEMLCAVVAMSPERRRDALNELCVHNPHTFEWEVLRLYTDVLVHRRDTLRTYGSWASDPKGARELAMCRADELRELGAFGLWRWPEKLARDRFSRWPSQPHYEWDAATKTGLRMLAGQGQAYRARGTPRWLTQRIGLPHEAQVIAPPSNGWVRYVGSSVTIRKMCQLNLRRNGAGEVATWSVTGPKLATRFGDRNCPICGARRWGWVKGHTKVRCAGCGLRPHVEDLAAYAVGWRTIGRQMVLSSTLQCEEFPPWLND